MELNESIQSRLGNWHEVMGELIQSNIWDDVFSFLKSESQAGIKIIPASGDLLKSFQLVDRHKMKCLILLQCPYATYRKVGNDQIMIADGIPMSCENIKPYQQPSLYQWYTALEKSYGFNPDNDLRCSLQYLLREEHVMLLNIGLSVEKDKVDSHNTQWHQWMKWFIENVINVHYKNLPIVLCGSAAQKFEGYINPLMHHIKKVEHPAAAAHQDRAWKYEDIFRWINQIIKSNNGQEIQWLRLKGEPTRVIEDSEVPF